MENERKSPGRKSAQSVAKTRKKISDENNKAFSQRKIFYVFPGGKDPNQKRRSEPVKAPSEIALQSALARIRRELSKAPSAERSALEAFLVDQVGIEEAATLAEYHRQPGGGLQYIREAFAQAQSVAGGRA